MNIEDLYHFSSDTSEEEIRQYQQIVEEWQFQENEKQQ